MGSLSAELFDLFLQIIVDIFFREVSFRGSFNIPDEGPTMCVIAPHANQYLDAAIPTYVTHKITGRQLRMIEAASSYRSKWMGLWSRWSGAIPVERAQDLLVSKEGTIRFENYPQDQITVVGKGTHFLTDAEPKGLLGLPNGNVKIAKIISDTKLILASPPTKGLEYLRNGCSYKIAPRVDNGTLFDNVFDELHDGAIIGIAPEGGSHDRPQLLELKPGVAIMALGAVAKHSDIEVNIVPCGLNYFHPNKFRSRAVLEYGRPIKVTQEMGDDYKKDARGTVNKLMKEIHTALKAVTTQAPDYETLQVIQAARRLYAFDKFKNPPLPIVVEINRNLLLGYSKFMDDPRIQHLKASVLEYNKKLSYYGFRDHQIEKATQNFLKSFFLLLQRTFLLLFYGLLSLPGTVLFAPIFIACRKISKRKQKLALKTSVVKINATDVLASWKVLVALFFAPLCYFIYSLIGTIIIIKYNMAPSLTVSWLGNLSIFFSCWAVLVATTYSALKMGEIGMDIFKSLRPLYFSMLPFSNDIQILKEERYKLSLEVTELINELGPKLFENFNDRHHVQKATEAIEDEYEIVRGRSRSGSRSRSRSRSISRSSSVSLSRTTSQLSGFSEFGTDDDGKLPNLAHVSIFPDDNYTASKDDLQNVDKSTGVSLYERIRNEVVQRNAGQDK